jgi:hypothetical protein
MTPNQVLELTPGSIAALSVTFLAGAVQHKRYEFLRV